MAREQKKIAVHADWRERILDRQRGHAAQEVATSKSARAVAGSW